MTDGQAGTAPPATTAAAVAPAAPAPTTAATQATTAPQAAAAPATGVGPRRVEQGVGVGYAHSQQGAVAAAANYTRALSSALILDTAKRRAAIDTLAAPEARARLQKTFDQAVASIRAGLGVSGSAGDGAEVLLRATPVGWRVEHYDKGTASGSAPVREGWGTTTVSLRWVGNDWKQVASTTTDGPVPIADVAPPTAAGELVSKANEFKEFTYAPGP
jgi:hypothetical protein